MKSSIFFAIVLNLISVNSYGKFLWARPLQEFNTTISEVTEGSSAEQTALATNWAQPPAACIEEVIPHKINKPCLDLTKAANPMRDWPTDATPEEIQFWKLNPRPLQYCRGTEVLRRESERPGSFSASTIEIAWMYSQGAVNSDLKIQSVYQASRQFKMPAQILAGALHQESLFAQLGITEDGGNYSCGIGQLNIVEWCHWANSQSKEKKVEMKWPQKIQCGQLNAILLKPFHQIAMTRLNGLPEYRLDKPHFKNISYKDVAGKFPAGPEDLQQLRYQSVVSFINYCQSPEYGIPAKANELARLYRDHIPLAFKLRENYRTGEKYQRKCREEGFDSQYPYHSGWLMAVGSYNAGPRAVDSLAYFNFWTDENLKNPETLKDHTPKEIVENLYWTGKYDPKDDRIHYTNLDANPDSWNWFKVCVLQRHIARIVQHTIIPGKSSPVDSQEGPNVCARSVFDPNTGKLIKSGVPDFRQKSSGQRQKKQTL